MVSKLLKIKNPFTGTLHLFEPWGLPTYRILNKGRRRRSYIKHTYFTKSGKHK